MSAFSKILIANRGEIAIRIAKTAHALGFATVAVYSEADRNAPHAVYAGEAVCIGPAQVSKSYLNIERIIEAAHHTGAQAVHPGYGFLSENPDFARACNKAGLIFIGPPAAAIASMGNKRLAGEIAQKADVPCIPGYRGPDQSNQHLMERAKEIGFPLMVKAAAGGGGRGMRAVSGLGELDSAIESARSEALAAFGNGELLLEKAITGARHIEIQVFADQHGKTLYLGERDCSLQRRHQKVVEEAPSPAVDEDLRKRMGEAAVALARAVDYVGAGTVEFLLDGQQNFYFLEMNTRLQVEHGVTELITGLDLVAMQLQTATGQPLTIDQEELKCLGHAMEVRLYAESPEQGFLPRSGPVHCWQTPENPHIRIDHALCSGAYVTPHYDPMVAKIMSFGPDRETARKRLRHALDDTVLLGVEHNLHYLKTLLEDRFIQGNATTDLIDNLPAPEPQTPSREEIALAAALLADISAARYPLSGSLRSLPLPMPFLFSESGNTHRIDLAQTGPHQFQTPDGDINIEITSRGQHKVAYRLNGQTRRAHYAPEGQKLHLKTSKNLIFFDQTYHPPQTEMAAGEGRLTAVMDGRIVDVMAAEGMDVTAGQTLVVMEAMKMEHRIDSDVDGEVAKIHISKGAQVKARSLLIEVKPRENGLTCGG